MGAKEFNQQSIITATTSKSMAYSEAKSTASLASSVQERLYIYSPIGSISSVKALYTHFAPITEAGAVAGTKNVYIEVGGIGIAQMNGNNNADVVYTQGAPNGTTSTSPTDIAAFETALQGLMFDSVVGMSVTFAHSAGVNTLQERWVRIFAMREQVSQ